MKKLEPVQFAAHAQLKNIVGQEMINDDNIAVKELVKNSIDANARRIDVKFENTESISDEAKIIIKDNGSGMSMKDILQKWLNIAYSSKKFDTERNYAGNKGIGRFSADRLGGRLQLYTRKKGEARYIKVDVDWGKFENKTNWKDKIENVDIERFTLTPNELEEELRNEKFLFGTYILITELRFPWSHDKLLGLKKDLEKFVIPSQIGKAEKFNLYIHALTYDKNSRTKDEKISGKVLNQVFNQLPFKTSYVKSTIDDSGKYITTELFYQSELLFALKEKNKFKKLSNVSILLFYLNPYHKAFFKKQTGMRVVQYGSVFLYLNGFRIPPYGDTENDWLGIDSRRAQGHSRFLGLRDVLGRIELQDGSGQIYHVASDREGIRENAAFEQLADIREGYFGHVFRKLEKFIVDGLSWDKTIIKSQEIEKRVDLYNDEFDKFDAVYAEADYAKGERLIDLFDKIILHGTVVAEIEKLEFGDKALEIIQNQRNENIQKLQEKLDKYSVTVESENGAFRPDTLIKTVKEAKEAISSLTAQVATLEIKVEEDEKSKEQLLSEALFLRANKNADLDAAINMHHQIIAHVNTIDTALDNLLDDIKNIRISEKNLRRFVSEVREETQLIMKYSKFATNANFRLNSKATNADILSFVKEYIKKLNELRFMRNLVVQESIPENLRLVKKFRPLELTIAIDCILSNAKKADAKTVMISTSQNKDGAISLYFENDGKGLDSAIKDAQSIFSKGVSTTEGSGLGLHMAKDAFTKLPKGKIYVKDTRSGKFSIGVDF